MPVHIRQSQDDAARTDTTSFTYWVSPTLVIYNAHLNHHIPMKPVYLMHWILLDTDTFTEATVLEV